MPPRGCSTSVALVTCWCESPGESCTRISIGCHRWRSRCFLRLAARPCTARPATHFWRKQRGIWSRRRWVRGDTIEVAGAALVADPAGALYWPDQMLLAVADLHLEKGSSF